MTRTTRWPLGLLAAALASCRSPDASSDSPPGRFAVVAYTPKPGHESALLAAVRKHVAVLRDEGLVTDRSPAVMRAADGTIVEVFEWRSAEAINRAHANPAVLALWTEFGAACEFTPLARLPESRQLFAEFDAILP